MESNICKGTKNDFSYFVDMALQNRMPWKTLASLLTDLAPTLNETREVVRILLKELGPIHLLNTRKYWANTWKMCSPASVILASNVTILVSSETILVYFKACCRKITLKLTSYVEIYRNPLQNCFKTYKYCGNTCKYYTCRWTRFSSIGSILVSIISILTSIATILASI